MTDKYGNPVPGISVTFAAPTSGASAALSNSMVTTGANGQASVTATANATLGSYTVTASATGVSSASFSLSNITVAEANGDTLRAAILSANSDTTDNVVTIQLAAGTYALSLGQLEISTTTTAVHIIGTGSSGPDASIIDAGARAGSSRWTPT